MLLLEAWPDASGHDHRCRIDRDDAERPRKGD
jgi:hypothetical protein